MAATLLPTFRGLVVCVGVAGLLALTGCFGGGPGSSPDGWDYGDDERSVDGGDVTDATDGGGPPPGWDGDEPQETIFELANRTGAAIRVEVRADCRADPPGWLELTHDSREFDPTSSRCRTCRCSTVESQGACEACAGCVAPLVEKVAADESVAWQWAGEAFLRDEVDGDACYRRRVPEVGTDFSAEFCWSTAEGPTGDGETLQEPTCEKVEFTYGEDDPIEHTL